ncbi:unnamed protein product, partial [Larinioides sclopetarius]
MKMKNNDNKGCRRRLNFRKLKSTNLQKKSYAKGEK